jgi:hypothetical protein
MKRTLIAAALVASFPLCYAQTSSSGAAPITGPQFPPGMPSNPSGNSSIVSPVQGSTPNSPSSAGPGSNIGSVGTGPTSTGSSVGATIQGQPLPGSGPVSPPSQPNNLGGTAISPGVLGSAPASPGVIGSPTTNGPCIGTVGTNSCPPSTQ